MATITIIVIKGAHQYQDSYTAYRIAKSAINKGHKVNLFFSADAVLNGIKDQDKRFKFNIEQLIKELLGKGVDITICEARLTQRGLKRDDLIKGVKYGSLMNLADMVEGSEKIISVVS